MSETDEHPLLRGSRQVLMLGSAVMAVAAAVVLAVGTQDARLLRLGLVAALWAALLAAFATARARREMSSCAEHADQLRTVYQRELEREIAARREHVLTVERELREQEQRSQRREIVELRTELSALRAHLEQLLGSSAPARQAPLRVEPANLLPQLRFGPHRPQPSPWVSPALPPGTAISNGATSHGQSRHGAAPSTAPIAAQAQRTVSDLLAAHEVASTGAPPTPQRRRSHDDRPATSGEGVFRHFLGGVAR